MAYDQYDKLKNIANQIDNNRNKEATATIDGLLHYYQQDVVERTINTALPESVFVSTFLRYFYIYARTGRFPNDELLRSWLSIAGSPYNEVDILDDRTQQVIYTVPSFYVQDIVDTEKLKEFDFTGVGTNYIKKSARLQEDADNYLNYQMSTMPKCIKNNSLNSLKQRWFNIFSRYYKRKDSNPIEQVINKEILSIDIPD